jgi:hypothetical protein
MEGDNEGSLIYFFFKEVKLNRIESMHDPRNSNSEKLWRNVD